MATAKKTAETAATTAPAELPLPAKGGCWIRQPDGSLVLDTDEHPDAAPAAGADAAQTQE